MRKALIQQTVDDLFANCHTWSQYRKELTHWPMASGVSTTLDEFLKWLLRTAHFRGCKIHSSICCVFCVKNKWRLRIIEAGTSSNFQNEWYCSSATIDTLSANFIMTSLNGNIFRVTGRLCREFTGHRWSSFRKASDAELRFDKGIHLCLNKRLSKQPRSWWFETPSHSLSRHRNIQPHENSFLGVRHV